MLEITDVDDDKLCVMDFNLDYWRLYIKKKRTLSDVECATFCSSASQALKSKNDGIPTLYKLDRHKFTMIYIFGGLNFRPHVSLGKKGCEKVTALSRKWGANVVHVTKDDHAIRDDVVRFVDYCPESLNDMNQHTRTLVEMLREIGPLFLSPIFEVSLGSTFYLYLIRK